MKLINSVVGAVVISLVPVSAILVSGATIPLPSSTAASEPDLAGVVLHDALIPFVVKDTLGRVLCGEDCKIASSARPRLACCISTIASGATVAGSEGASARQSP